MYEGSLFVSKINNDYLKILNILYIIIKMECNNNNSTGSNEGRWFATCWSA
jgi:hypothetical protein